MRAGVDRSMRSIASVAAAVLMAGSVAGAATASPLLAVGVGAVLVVVVVAVVQRERSRLAAAVVEPVEQLAERASLVARGLQDGVGELPATAPAEVLQAVAGMRALHDRVRAGQALLRRRDAELERYDDDLALLVELTRDVTGSANVAYVLRTAARAAMAAAGVQRAVVWLKDEGVLRGRYDSAAADAFAPGGPPVAIGDGRVGAAAAGNTVVVGGDGRSGARDAPTGAAVPMSVGGRVVGVVELIGESLVELSPQQRWVLELVASHTASVLHAARLENRADLIGRVDPVTGLPNYRQFVVDLAVEVERAARYGRPLALVLLDVGGDATGTGWDPTAVDDDPVARRHDEDRLAVAGTVVDGESRACDSVYRFGRGELAVLVRESTELGATVYARRLCRRLEQVAADALGGAGLAVRAGVAELSPGPAGEGGRLGGRVDDDAGGPPDGGRAADGLGNADGIGNADGPGNADGEGADLLRRAAAALAAAEPDVGAAAGPGPVVCWSALAFPGVAGHAAVEEGAPPGRQPEQGGAARRSA